MTNNKLESFFCRKENRMMDKHEAMKKKIKELKKMMRDEYSSPLKDKLGDMQVTVAADDAEGLEEGLEKAESMAEKIKKGMLGDMMEPSYEESEQPEEEEMKEPSSEEKEPEDDEEDSESDEYEDGGSKPEMDGEVDFDEDDMNPREYDGEFADGGEKEEDDKSREEKLKELVDLGILSERKMKQKLGS